MKAVTLAVLLVTSSVMATPVAESYNTDLEIHEFLEQIETPKNFEVKLAKPTLSRGDMDVTDLTVLFDQIVNLGKKVWALVESSFLVGMRGFCNNFSTFMTCGGFVSLAVRLVEVMGLNTK